MARSRSRKIKSEELKNKSSTLSLCSICKHWYDINLEPATCPHIFFPVEEGKKFDQEKPMMALLPPVGIEEEARVMTYGMGKYGAHNWQKGIKISRYLSAALRHIFQFIAGQDNDLESGLGHLGHAKANLGMAIQLLSTRPDLDDRYKGEPNE